MITKDMNRRDFVKFLGRAGLSMSALGSMLSASGCSSSPKSFVGYKIPSLTPNSSDDLDLAEGLNYQVLLSYGDQLSSNQVFGFNCDFNAFLPLNRANTEGILWTNNESIDPYFTFVNSNDKYKRSKPQVDLERSLVGGSISHIKKVSDAWTLVKESKFNRRIDGTTKIPFAPESEIGGQKYGEGTLGNCAGGLTPWNTFLSCEENYHEFYGEVSFVNGKRKTTPSTDFFWERVYNRPPEHYGWVIEIDPKTGDSKTLVSLGRFAHEGATCVTNKDKRVVVYMGDDKPNQCFYKFVSSSPDSLEEGQLFVANLEENKWELLHYKDNPKLKGLFSSQLELLISTRVAAKKVGGTPLDRPEDVEVDPLTGDIYLCCTNNPVTGVKHGSILKLQEKDRNHAGTSFTSSVWLKGGPEAGFSSPDNLTFDKNGHLWMTCDVSEKRLNKGDYASFGNNALFFIPTYGPQAGKAFRMVIAPKDAELTGPWFTPDYETLFLSVQHPGSMSSKMKKLTSHWPLGAPHTPKPSVVAITGPLFKSLIG